MAWIEFGDYQPSQLLTPGTGISQVEICFSILSRHALHGANFLSILHVPKPIYLFIATNNYNAAPFELKIALPFLKNAY